MTRSLAPMSLLFTVVLLLSGGLAPVAALHAPVKASQAHVPKMAKASRITVKATTKVVVLPLAGTYRFPVEWYCANNGTARVWRFR